ncbi:hypothetical protein D3C76_377460 [compost metagenome]
MACPTGTAGAANSTVGSWTVPINARPIAATTTPSAPRRVKMPAARWTGTVSNAPPPATWKPVTGRAKPSPGHRPAIGCRPGQTDPMRLIDPWRPTEARALPETLGRIRRGLSNPGIRQINAYRAAHRRARRRKNARPHRPSIKAVRATMPSPARVHRHKPTFKPIAAGPARLLISAPMPREPPATRSVGRPVHQRVQGGAAVE